jgi:hypothetical protein
VTGRVIRTGRRTAAVGVAIALGIAGCGGQSTTTVTKTASAAPAVTTTTTLTAATTSTTATSTTAAQTATTSRGGQDTNPNAPDYYPTTFETSFISSCQKNGGSSARCSCALSYVLAHYTYSQILGMTVTQIAGLDLKAVANCLSQ